MSTVAFVVNGGYESAMGFRARDLASRLTQYDIHIAYRSKRKILSILRIFSFLCCLRPQATYVLDISYSGVLSAGLYRLLFRNYLIMETGDAIVELARSTGSRGKFGLWLTGLLEKAAFWLADRVVVRGSFHQEWLAREGLSCEVIPDGVDPSKFAPQDAGDLRKELGLNGELTIGLIGSSVWSEKLQMCYGWELVETISLLRDSHVKGIMIGTGSGIARLKARCRAGGIEDRILFLDHVPYRELSGYLALIDVCLSTQTNNLVGQVRTTGKLPLYLATGRYVLASNVGEAARVLEPEMLVPYEGVKDQQYPQKLATRIRAILENPAVLERGAGNVLLAKKYFDYSLLADRAAALIQRGISGRR